MDPKFASDHGPDEQMRPIVPHQGHVAQVQALQKFPTSPPSQAARG
jgi:hypothetical protein